MFIYVLKLIDNTYYNGFVVLMSSGFKRYKTIKRNGPLMKI